jgi:hypothetical protein
MASSNWTRFSRHISHVIFDEFEMLYSKLYSQLKILSSTPEFEDITNVDADRWKQLIYWL